MDKVIETILTQGGLLGAILIAVVLYFIKAEKTFWQERKDFNDRIQRTYEEFHAVMRERYSEQQRVTEELFQGVAEMKLNLLQAEKEFVSLKEAVEAKFEHLAILMNQNQRFSRIGGQKGEK